MDCRRMFRFFMTEGNMESYGENPDIERGYGLPTISAP